jgi:hypothetical protein
LRRRSRWGWKHVVKVIDGGAVKEKQNGKTLLRIRDYG